MVKAAEETRSGESESEERRDPGWEQTVINDQSTSQVHC